MTSRGVRATALAVVVGIALTATTGCSDDQPGAASGLAMVAEEAAAEATTTTAPSVTTTTADPAAAREADFLASLEMICAGSFDGVRGGPPDDIDALLEWTRTLEAAYQEFADRVERLTPPDRQTEANLVEGLRRLRRAADLLVPAMEAATGRNTEDYDRAWWSFDMAISGAGTALYAAGIPDSCWG